MCMQTRKQGGAPGKSRDGKERRGIEGKREVVKQSVQISQNCQAGRSSAEPEKLRVSSICHYLSSSKEE